MSSRTHILVNSENYILWHASKFASNWQRFSPILLSIFICLQHSLDEVHCLAWSPTAEGLLASGGHDHVVNVYDAGLEDGGGELYKRLDGHSSEVCLSY